MSLSAVTSFKFDAKSAFGNCMPFKGEQACRQAMAVRIRFARFGRKKKPFYRIMAADQKSSRDGSHIEILGHYNPLAGDDDDKRLGLNYERVKYWLSVGAQPSEPVERILRRVGVLPPWSQKAAPRDARTPASSDQPKDSKTGGDDDDSTTSA